MEHVDDDPSLCALRASCHRLSAFQEGAQLGDEREGATLVFFVVPGSSRTKPPARSTCCHRRGRTSERLRHPVMNMNCTASPRSGERWRQIAATCLLSAKPGAR